MNQLTSIAVIIAIVELIKKYVPQVNGVVTVMVAAVLGGIAGYFGIDGLNVQTGIIAGVSASGINTIAKRVAGK